MFSLLPRSRALFCFGSPQWSDSSSIRLDSLKKEDLEIYEGTGAKGGEHWGDRHEGDVNNWFRTPPRWNLPGCGIETKLSQLDTVYGNTRQHPDRFDARRRRLHCILHVRDLEVLALVLACAVGQLIMGVYWSFIPNCTNFLMKCVTSFLAPPKAVRNHIQTQIFVFDPEKSDQRPNVLRNMRESVLIL